MPVIPHCCKSWWSHQQGCKCFIWLIDLLSLMTIQILAICPYGWHLHSDLSCPRDKVWLPRGIWCTRPLSKILSTEYVNAAKGVHLLEYAIKFYSCAGLLRRMMNWWAWSKESTISAQLLRCQDLMPHHSQAKRMDMPMVMQTEQQMGLIKDPCCEKLDTMSISTNRPYYNSMWEVMLLLVIWFSPDCIKMRRNCYVIHCFHYLFRSACTVKQLL